MKRKIFALAIAMMALVFMGCPNPATDTPVHDQAITSLAISGVTAPALGVTPVTTIAETAQYTGTVKWSGTPESFVANTVYTATIALTAKAGWTLSGVAANSFMVDGATSVTYAANSGVVTAVFPATLDGHYTSATIGILEYVPAGTFNRDGVAGNNSTVSAFRMSRYEITRAQYTAVTLAADPSNVMCSSGNTDPVQQVTWFDAVEFCNNLSEKEGLTAVYAISGRTPATGFPITDATVTVSDWNANGYRLPTEMEWMWAAMGAASDAIASDIVNGVNTRGYLKSYAGSREASGELTNIGNYAWYRGNVSDSKSQPVGGKVANGLDLYDMSGNIFEWIWDWYGDYPMGAQTDYRGATSGMFRVLRGGSWYDLASYCTVSYRGYDNPLILSFNYGFRVVRP